MKTNVKISILGSTGSIGTNALDVIDKVEGYEVQSLSCNSQIDILEEQVLKYNPKYVCVYDEKRYKEAKSRLSSYTKVLSGMQGLLEIASDDESDILLTSMVGNIGLLPTMEAIKNSKRIALANKETLVTAGELIMKEAQKNNSEIIPVDSEHSAIFQSLQGNDYENIKKVILTASGGPFRGKDKAFISNVKAVDALKHPNWAMGRKITIDSATLMNKGLEVIEAKHLFSVDLKQIEVIVHPQSIIHSMVEYNDSSIIAQLGVPDMKLPIHYAFSYPQRTNINLETLSFTKLQSLTFFEPDIEAFPCLRLAYEASKMGGIIPTVLNAVNEIMVEKFLEDKISFYDISENISKFIYTTKNIMSPSLDDILQIDKETRIKALEI